MIGGYLLHNTATYSQRGVTVTPSSLRSNHGGFFTFLGLYGSLKCIKVVWGSSVLGCMVVFPLFTVW